jgi:hypothetical protein
MADVNRTTPGAGGVVGARSGAGPDGGGVIVRVDATTPATTPRCLTPGTPDAITTPVDRPCHAA